MLLLYVVLKNVTGDRCQKCKLLHMPHILTRLTHMKRIICEIVINPAFISLVSRPSQCTDTASASEGESSLQKCLPSIKQLMDHLYCKPHHPVIRAKDPRDMVGVSIVDFDLNSYCVTFY